MSSASAQLQRRLYRLVPAPDADPDAPQQPPATLRCDRELDVGSQVWVQQECWELLERCPAPEGAAEQAAFVCATSARPRARLLVGLHETCLYEPDLIDLAGAVRGVHADVTPATRTIQAAIRVALHGGTDVDANFQGDALRVLAQAIRGLEISRDLSPTLHELARNLSQHFDDLRHDQSLRR